MLPGGSLQLAILPPGSQAATGEHYIDMSYMHIPLYSYVVFAQVPCLAYLPP